MAASLVRQPKHAVRSVGNAVVRCREKRGSRLARIRCNRVHCPAKPTVVGNSLSSFWVSLCPDRLHCKRKRHCFFIKTCRPPRQKRWFISVPYCPYYSTLVTVLQDFFIGFFRSLSRKYSWKSKKFDNFVQGIQKFLLISHGNRRFPNNSRFYPSLLFSRIPH